MKGYQGKGRVRDWVCIYYNHSIIYMQKKKLNPTKLPTLVRISQCQVMHYFIFNLRVDEIRSVIIHSAQKHGKQLSNTEYVENNT